MIKQKSYFLLLSLLFIFLLLLAIGGKTMALGRLRINSPSFKEESYNGIRFRLSKPANYKENNKELYPLVVFLHGAGGRGSDNRKASLSLSYLGNGFSATAREFRKKYPCFIYVPQAPEKTSWKANYLEPVITTIEHLKKTYPIDTKRLYLIGYSMGGSGTYSLAGKYLQEKGQLFAGIIRLAGQGTFSKQVHETVSKSSAWLHIGLHDTQLRVTKARNAYEFQRNTYPEAQERIVEENKFNQVVVTSTLTLDNQERFKLSEYSAQGHNINTLPFQDPAVIQWLFSKTL